MNIETQWNLWHLQARKASLMFTARLLLKRLFRFHIPNKNESTIFPRSQPEINIINFNLIPWLPVNENFKYLVAMCICFFFEKSSYLLLSFQLKYLASLLSVCESILYILTSTWGGLKSRLYTLPLGGWIQRRLRRSLSVSNGMFKVITRSRSQILSRASAWTNVLGKPKCQKQNIINARHLSIPISRWNITYFQNLILKENMLLYNMAPAFEILKD